MGEATGLISLSASSFEIVDVYIHTHVRVCVYVHISTHTHCLSVYNCKLGQQLLSGGLIDGVMCFTVHI